MERSVSPSPDRFHAPPDRELWLRQIRLECFDEVMGLDEAALRAALDEELHDAPARRARDQLVARLGASPALARHLLLLLRFLEHRKAAALLAVARRALSLDALRPLLSDAGRPHRLALAVALYEADPRHLVEVLVWDRWHTRRRVSYRLTERHRHLPPLAPEAWLEHARRALAELQGEAPARYAGLEALVVTSSEQGSLLFGFREPTHLGMVTRTDGEVVSGWHEGWGVLALHDDGMNLDVTDLDLERGPALASRLLRAVRGGACRYELVADPLTEEAMARFLGQLTDPRDERFPLLEITARVPGRRGEVLHTVSGPHQERVEVEVAELRRVMAFALDWRDVRTVKVGFEGRYRFTLELEEEQGAPVIWYSDRERDKDTSRRFELQLRAALGVRIAPRPGTRARVRVEERPPRRASAAWWSALLRGRVDRPADWMLPAWTELETAGLVRVTWSTVLRCGTPFLPRHVPEVEARECPGEVTMAYGAWDPAAPLVQDPESEFLCPLCDRVWRPGRYRLPLVERARVDVLPEAAWARVRASLAPIAEVRPFPGEPGVAEVRFPTGLYFLAFTPLLAEGSSFRPGAGLAARTAWVTLDATEGGGASLSLPELLADPTALGAVWRLPSRGAPVATSAAVAPVAEPAADEARYTITLRGKAVYLEEIRLLPGNASAQRQLLVLLALLAREDQRRGRPERRGYSVDRIIELARGLDVPLTEDQVRLQLHRLNEAGRTALARAGLRPLELAEHGPGGYRLNSRVDVGSTLLGES